MKRFLSVLAAVAFALAPASSARAVNSLTASIVVDCDDADGSSTAEPLGITMPAGWYAVEITGACFLAYPGLDGCHLLAYAYTGGCAAPATVGACTAYHVAVDGQCPTLGGAGLIYHNNSGPVTAKVVDCCYGDNEGYFVVTVTWTAL
ncbi:MAG TPA: hypothetical protein VNA20_01525 [Frankiaceae bacterium]|nr:hypothetical protein [Frankiaceae bacterium]